MFSSPAGVFFEMHSGAARQDKRSSLVGATQHPAL
jgi:hypothetical protein